METVVTILLVSGTLTVVGLGAGLGLVLWGAAQFSRDLFGHRRESEV